MSALRAPDVSPPVRRERPSPAVRISRSRPRLRQRLRIVPRRAERTRRWPFRAFAVLAVGGLLMAVVAMQALVNQTSFKMRDLQHQTKEVRQTYAQLRLQVADLSVPGRIVSEAASLGLRLPDTQSVHVLQVRVPKGSTPRPRDVTEGSFGLRGTIGDRP